MNGHTSSIIFDQPYFYKLRSFFLGGQKNLKANLKKIVADLPQHDTILDLCCGIGEFESQLTFDGKYAYCGVDCNKRYKEYYDKKKSGHFFCDDVRNLSFPDNTFDVVYLINASHHFNDQDIEKVLQEINRVSRKFLILVDAHKSSNDPLLVKTLHTLDRGNHIRSKAELENLMNLFFNIEQRHEFKNSLYNSIIFIAHTK